MEFHEKLQELRKQRGLTQEELAEALYVSRTAISKWESGRGYPNIDSLKEISNFFSVSIDDLLSSEKMLFIAEFIAPFSNFFTVKINLNFSTQTLKLDILKLVYVTYFAR